MSLRIQSNVNLQPFNTLAVPSLAEFFVEVDSADSLREALHWAHGNQKNIMLLGGGSNVILPARVTALVIRIAIPGIDVEQENDTHVFLRVGAGVVWHDLVIHCLQKKYHGLENLSLIPGTVGAAPMQNIGAYGVELESVFERLTAMDCQTLELVHFDKAQCEFSYRDSAFKNHLRQRFAICSVTLKLCKQPAFNLTYSALADALANKKQAVDAKLLSDTVCEIRRSKLPDPNQIPNVGSFFKNPVVTAAQLQQLKQQHPDIVSFPFQEGRYKIAAGWLVDQAGWKGFQNDGVGVFQHQALVLINPGRCGSDAVLALAASIQDDVRKKFGIELEIEPDIIAT